MLTEELKQEIKREIKAQIQEAKITNVKVEKLRNEIILSKNELRTELKEDIHKLSTEISEIKGMIGVVTIATVGILILLIKDILK